MRASFLAAINQICSEKNVSADQVIEAVKQAIATAYRKDFGNKEQEIRVEFEEGKDMPTILLVKEVVKEVENENFEISLKDARRIKPDSEIADEIAIDVTPLEYGRIATQAAKQVILQKLQEAEKQSLYEMFKDREAELLTATVTKVDPNWVTLEIEGMTVSLPWREQIPGEHYYTGKRIRVFLDTVELTGKGPQLRISRTHPSLVKKLLELEIPEVRNGDVEVMAIARDAGFRSKVAVRSKDPRIDPIGACVGQKGVRIQAVMEEINGERVDMIEWSEDPIKLISLALQPAAISAVIIVNGEEHLDDQGRRIKKRAAVFVEEAQRPMAIGKKGQNIRLATELTGFELDMYNYEELPAFKAKLAALRGGDAMTEEPEVTPETSQQQASPPAADAEGVANEAMDQVAAEIVDQPATDSVGATEPEAKPKKKSTKKKKDASASEASQQKVSSPADSAEGAENGAIDPVNVPSEANVEPPAMSAVEPDNAKGTEDTLTPDKEQPLAG